MDSPALHVHMWVGYTITNGQSWQIYVFYTHVKSRERHSYKLFIAKSSSPPSLHLHLSQAFLCQFHLNFPALFGQRPSLCRYRTRYTHEDFHFFTRRSQLAHTYFLRSSFGHFICALLVRTVHKRAG